MYNKKILILVLIFWHASSSFSNPPTRDLLEQISIFDIEAAVNMSIRTDFEQIINNREIVSIPAAISVSFDNTCLEFDASVEVRGNFRRNTANCDFPPIRIQFKNIEIGETIFEGNQNVKIVTHCKEKSKQFLQYMAKEYTTYKIYNLLSPYSLKVKFVEITYVDDKERMKPIITQAFLIENIDHLAKRHNMVEFTDKLSTDLIDEENLRMLSVFQFMIGNTDWIIPFSKNLKSITDGEKIITVPYDFDYTAIVDTDYTVGGGQTFLLTPERKFKGPCYELSDLEAEFKKFEEKNKDIIQLISKSPYLKSNSKLSMKNYIDEFYSILNLKEKVIEYFQINCN